MYSYWPAAAGNDDTNVSKHWKNSRTFFNQLIRENMAPKSLIKQTTAKITDIILTPALKKSLGGV